MTNSCLFFSIAPQLSPLTCCWNPMDFRSQVDIAHPQELTENGPSMTWLHWHFSSKILDIKNTFLSISFIPFPVIQSLVPVNASHSSFPLHSLSTNHLFPMGKQPVFSDHLKIVRCMARFPSGDCSEYCPLWWLGWKRVGSSNLAGEEGSRFDWWQTGVLDVSFYVELLE